MSQASHMERNDVRAAYTQHAQYKDDCAKTVEWSADYLSSEEASHVKNLGTTYV